VRREKAEELLGKVVSDYEKMAIHFSRTRRLPWRELTFIKKFVSPGDFVLDLGCGNGRLFQLFSDLNISYVGLDVSAALIEEAQKTYVRQGAQFIISDALKLPFNSASFDVVFSIALLHHIPSWEYRCQLVKEVYRVLKESGLFFVSVWNLWQVRYLRFVLKSFLAKFFFVSDLDFRDVFIPWKSTDGRVIVRRYCHAFTRSELKKLFKLADFREIETGYTIRNHQRTNIYAKARKPGIKVR
jgi:ubiquinone/menaquinone biosynthesis C-methylase UbiE